MSDWKLQKTVDLTTIIAILSFSGIVIGWGVSIERRITYKLSSDVWYQENKDYHQQQNERFRDLKADIDTDIRILRERINQLPPP